MRRLVAVAALGWLVASALAALPAGTHLDANLAPPTIAVGDRVEATLTLHLGADDAALDATFPDWSRGWGDAEVLAASPVERLSEGGEPRLVQRLTLTAFRPGTVELPPVAVRLGSDPARSITVPAPLHLIVRSVLAADEKDAKPAPAAAPRPMPVSSRVAWALATALVLAGSSAWLAWRRGAFAAAKAIVPPLPPRRQLAFALGSLAGQAPDRAWRELSLAVRRYLGQTLAFPAAESTSTEIHRRLAARHLAPELARRGVKLLREADQVKFARRPATPSEIVAAIDEAAAVADAVEAHLHPEPAAAATAPTP